VGGRRSLCDEIRRLVGTALAWGLERLARSPAALDRLEAAVDAGEDAYLDATASETLRVRPVVPSHYAS
jgi:cytochrome P450